MAREKLSWTPLATDKLSPQVRKQFDAWQKAEQSAREAKAALEDTMTAIGAKKGNVASGQAVKVTNNFGRFAFAVIDAPTTKKSNERGADAVAF